MSPDFIFAHAKHSKVFHYILQQKIYRQKITYNANRPGQGNELKAKE